MTSFQVLTIECLIFFSAIIYGSNKQFSDASASQLTARPTVWDDISTTRTEAVTDKYYSLWVRVVRVVRIYHYGGFTVKDKRGGCRGWTPAPPPPPPPRQPSERRGKCFVRVDTNESVYIVNIYPDALPPPPPPLPPDTLDPSLWYWYYRHSGCGFD